MLKMGSQDKQGYIPSAVTAVEQPVEQTVARCPVGICAARKVDRVELLRNRGNRRITGLGSGRFDSRQQYSQNPVLVVDDQDRKSLVVHPRLDYRSLQDRKSTRLNSSHLGISYAVFCL